MTKVLVLGATGSIGLPLCKKLSSLGMTVVGTGATGRNFDELSKVAKPITMDVINKTEVESVIDQEGGDIVINCISKIPGWIKAWKPEKDFEQYNKIRIQGSVNLFKSITKHNPNTRLITLSHANCGTPYAETGGTPAVPECGTELMKSIGIDNIDGKYSDERIVKIGKMPTTNLKTESDEFPYVDHPVPVLALFNQAQYRLERYSRRIGESCVLRLGLLYGPGTTFSEGGLFYNNTKSGKLRTVSPSTGKWSFIHVDDAVSAIAKVALSENFNSGNFNVISDSEGTTAEDWMTRYSNHIGAPSPGVTSFTMARYVAPHMLHLCIGQRSADAGNFSAVYSWNPKEPPLWEA